MKVTTTPTTGVVLIQTTLGDQISASWTRESIKTNVFACFQGFYTSPHATWVQEVDITIQGPLVDPYGHTSTGPYASATLMRATASKFVWNNMVQADTWDNNLYDSEWMAPALVNG